MSRTQGTCMQDRLCRLSLKRALFADVQRVDHLQPHDGHDGL